MRRAPRTAPARSGSRSCSPCGGAGACSHSYFRLPGEAGPDRMAYWVGWVPLAKQASKRLAAAVTGAARMRTPGSPGHMLRPAWLAVPAAISRVEAGQRTEADEAERRQVKE